MTTNSDTYCYGELLLASRRLARTLLRDAEFIAGARVALLATNSPEYIAAFYGVLMAGGVVVPLPPDIESGRLAMILESTQASHLLAQPRVLKSRSDLRSATTQPGAAHDQSITRSLTETDCPPEMAAIFFTSGSSGTPKGVMLSHDNLIANADSIQQYLDINVRDRPLCVLPFYHAFGNSILQSHLLTGAELILDGSAPFPQSIIDALTRHRATSLSGVPDLFRFLLERSSLGRRPLSDLRYMAVAGGALRPQLAQDVASRIAPARLHIMYGQTEATARLSSLPFDPQRPGCIGCGIPSVTLQVVNALDQPVVDGEVGEIRAQGPNIMLGYWRDPETTRRTIRQGWLYTGDLAMTDRTGYLFVQGRRNSLLKIAGFRVHPGEVEEFVLRRLPIQQAVVVPFDLQGLGTRLALFAQVPTDTSSLSVADVLRVCRAELPRHLVPDHIALVDRFPLNDGLKIDRPRLASLAEQTTTKWRRTA